MSAAMPAPVDRHLRGYAARPHVTFGNPNGVTGMSSPPPNPARTQVAISGLRKSFRVAGKTIEAVRGIDLTVAAGRDLWAARAERRGEDHHPAHPHHPAARRRGPRVRRRRGRPARPGAGPAADRLRQPARRCRQRGDRAGEPAARRPAVRPERRRRQASAAPSSAEVFDLDGARRPPGPHLLGRPAPPARGRARHHAPARGCCSSTSRPPASTRRTGRTCGSSSGCCATAAPRSSSPRTTWTRPTSSATGSRSSITAGSSRSARPDELKQRYSADTIVGHARGVAPPCWTAVARELADAPSAASWWRSSTGTIRLTATDATRAMAAVFGALAARACQRAAASVARPSLDDVFLRETGRSLRDAACPERRRAPSREEVAA